ncbi:putative Ca(2+)/H(+) antiporter [Nannochloris sp. 'desiccata']|nr:putative Ca(2+)/H(+) antiporter [Chlorella desiccata (nom. nud.)]
MATFKEVRSLKGRGRRTSGHRRSVDEPLLSVEEGYFSGNGSVNDGDAAVAAAAAAAAAAVPAARGQSAQALWRVAHTRVSAVRALTSVSENAANLPPPRETSDIQPQQRRGSLIEKFMFSLSNVPSFTSGSFAGLLPPEECDPTSCRYLADGRIRHKKRAPGMWAPRSDIYFMSHMIWGSLINILLVAIPIGIFSGMTGASPNLVFWSNFLALLPLALILGEITEDLAVRFGDTVGGLLNASFGNVVEMILGLAALSRGLYKVVAASLIGSILSNLLLVLGCCFLFGGFKHRQQVFNSLANKVSSSLLFVSSISIIIPTAAKTVYGDKVMTRDSLINLSHAIAILLVIMYGCYLYFQLKTHADFMSMSAEDPLLHMASPAYFLPSTPAPDSAAAAANNTGGQLSGRNVGPSPFLSTSGSFTSNGNDSAGGNDADNVDTTAAAGGRDNEDDDDDDDDEDFPHLSLLGALFSLTLITITVAACSEFLTGAIEAVSESSGINQGFLGLIILPIAGNACEHMTAVFVAVKNKMDLAISVALGSSIQIASFVLPVTVLAGWAMGKELTLDFDIFAVLCLFCSVILAYFVSSDGSSNWLLGLQLVVTYLLIGAVYYLEDEAQGGGGGGAPLSSSAGLEFFKNATIVTAT